MSRLPKIVVHVCLWLAFSAAASAQEHPVYGPDLEGFDYPYPVQTLPMTSQRQTLQMAFMDVAPTANANGRIVVLLHGKNFCAATWGATIKVLSDAGYRVIAPDQIGFCKSSKPETYQYSFAQLAKNTADLLAARGISRAIIIGHSMGGMLAARFSLQYPDMVERLVMVNPLGLEDWQAEGVPYASIDANYQNEMKTSFDSIKAYEQRFYYSGQWRPEYDRWVEMLAGMHAGTGKAQVAWSQALLSDMIFTQPVVHEFGRISVPTVLFIGQTDTTAPGANRAPPAIAQRLGNYPELGRRAAKAIPGATLVEFAGLGHAPQIESPQVFHDALLKALAQR